MTFGFLIKLETNLDFWTFQSYQLTKHQAKMSLRRTKQSKKVFEVLKITWLIVSR
jgi:hypothetical protein